LRQFLFLALLVFYSISLSSQKTEDMALITSGRISDPDSSIIIGHRHDSGRRDSYFTVVLKFPILFYQEFISSQMKPRCYFYPSCSAFTADAIEKYGMYGVFLGIDRIMRCNVFSEEKYPYYGSTTRMYDPVKDYGFKNENVNQCSDHPDK
jgi:putative component of membrane protein insertase Oxa1/YidC/SpoIIIJ protein YidD